MSGFLWHNSGDASQVDMRACTTGSTVNGNWSYGYDGFNRLASSSCSANSTANCPNGQSAEGYTYAYDRFGNRWQQNVTGPAGTPGIASSVSFSSANNRVDQETYDASGDVTSDGALRPARSGRSATSGPAPASPRYADVPRPVRSPSQLRW